jgi:polyisoprenoid-binding protein YceI
MSTVATPAITIWNVDPTHSVVEFKVKHMMISNVKGQFTGVTGTLSLHEADLRLRRSTRGILGVMST